MPSEFDYFKNKNPRRIYISKSIQPKPSTNEPNDLRKIRILSKVFDSKESHQFVRIHGEVVLRVSQGERQEIKATFYEDDRQIKALVIQRFTRKDGEPHRYHFTFRDKEIETLYNLLKMIRYTELEGNEKIHFDANVLNQWSLTDEEKRHFLVDNLEMVEEVVRNHVTTSDVVALGYRKQQLGLFRRLLEEPDFFRSKQQEWNKRGKEVVWQHFFEENPWIFGYGLNYIFTSRLEDRKLEQVTTGHAINSAGKRVDALMKTRGLISSLCFVEIKTHDTLLIKQDEAYRPESWRISDELAGSIAQIQKTVNKALKNIQTKLELQNSDGTLTGETVFLYQPKSFIVIGCLQEFISEHGINEQKYSSFELFRKSMPTPEIITFDELYERARFIVEHSEHEKPFTQSKSP